MSRIKIGSSERDLSDANESWIVQQIRTREENGGRPCVQVFLKCGSVDVMLSTPQCAVGGGGGGRAPNQKEQEIFQLWNSRHMNSPEWAIGNLIAFLKQVE